ncbi:MAG TPA: GDP-L-fucose synthase [Myxococcota bacterium]|nr:GDP-L-fucose synthase [Myxococcota bacterium]
MSEYIRGRRILVTGGAGFLGRRVCAQLEARGARELIVPRRKSCDLTSPDAVRALFEASRPEIVVHLAAEVGGIGANRAQPGRFFYANMAMGLHVVEEARRCGVAKLVGLATVCAYPKYTPVPFSEDDLWNGFPEETNAPYGVAKKALLLMMQSYRAQYGLNAIGLLPVNLFGPGDSFDPETSHVIPGLVRKFIEARQRGDDHVTCWGSGSASREFLYVDDCAEAVALALERYDGAEPVNVGAGRETTIRELAELIGRLCGFAGELRWDRSKPDGQPRRCLDTTRAEEEFGFTARVGLEEGLRRTVEFYEKQIDQAPRRD